MNGFFSNSAIEDKVVCCMPAPATAAAAAAAVAPCVHRHPMHPALAIPYHFQQHVYPGGSTAAEAAPHFHHHPAVIQAQHHPISFPSFYAAATATAASAPQHVALAASQFTPAAFSIGSSTSDSSSESSSVMFLPQMMMIEGRAMSPTEQQIIPAFPQRLPSPGVPAFAVQVPRPQPAVAAPDWMIWSSLPAASVATGPGIPAPMAPQAPQHHFDGMASLMRAAQQFPNTGFFTFPDYSTSFSTSSTSIVSRKRKAPHVQCTYTTAEYGKCPKKPAVGDIRTIRQTNRFTDGSLRTRAVLEEVAASDRGKELLGFVSSHVADRKEVLLAALVYFELAARRKAIRKGTSIRSLCKRMMICIILAGKWLDDDHVDNAEWSRRLNVSLKCVNRLERGMFDNLGYELSVSQQEMLTVLEQLGSAFGLLRQH